MRAAPEDGDAPGRREGVDEHLEPLSAQHGFAVRHAGEVAAGVREALGDAQSDRIGDEGEHDGTFQAGLLERADRRGRDRDDDIGRPRREPGDERLEPVGVSLPAEHLDRRRAAVFVAELLKRLDKRWVGARWGYPLCRMAMRGRSCARAALGLDAASSPAMNVRRLIRSPRRRERGGSGRIVDRGSFQALRSFHAIRRPEGFEEQAQRVRPLGRRRRDRAGDGSRACRGRDRAAAREAEPAR